MAASAGSQHRCVFVGNIPYDATEEQLIQICEEVGPVVSFRLVTDRETGKPKGYGFCEYKDEETALSARRNLQGYEINGRQLRVDFAENDKNTDRNREQGRGGPGLASSIDAQKHLAGPVPRDSALSQPIGLPSAATAASLMAGALGGAQAVTVQNGLRNLSGIGNDPLSHYLARLSKHQLTEIMAEIKALATQNKAVAQQLLQGIPQLPKALFQAQIMLGLVTPQMMQMANSWQSSSSVPQPLSHLGQAPSQKEAAGGTLPRPPEALIPSISQNAVHLPQSGPLLQHVPIQPPYQHHQQMQALVLQGTMLDKSATATVPSMRPQSVGGPVQSTPPLPTSKGLIPQIQPPNLQQHPRPVGTANLAHNTLLSLPNTSLQQSVLPHPLVPLSGSSGYAPPLSGLETLAKGSGDVRAGISAPDSVDPTWASRISTQNLSAGLVEQSGMTTDISELLSHPSKLRRLEDVSGVPQMINSSSHAINPVLTQTIGTGLVSGNQTAHVDAVQHSDRQMPQISPEVETVLLQQVLSLTPEQLSSLPLEQQQQVLQLQQMLSVSK